MGRFGVLKKLVFLFTCIMLTSCGGKNGKETGLEKTGDIDTITPTPANQDLGGFSKKMDGDGAIGDALALTGKRFGELPVVGAEDAVYCNLPENVTSWDSIVPICLDPLYGILYYVDYGGDYMIHAVYDGEEQTVVELPGRRLFCRGGKLYFLLDSYNRFSIEGAKSGNIAEYDPVTGNVKVLVDQAFTSMVVYQDMIYCRVDQGSREYGDGYVGITDYWFYFFDTGILQLFDSEEKYVLNFQRYGEYFMAVTLEEDKDNPQINVGIGMELRKWDGERGSVWEGLFPSYTYYVKDGGIHWLDVDGFHVWDIASEQDKVYPVEYEKAGQYLLVGGRLFHTEHWLADLEDGRYEKWNSMDEKLKKVHELYTDGKVIYAIAGPLMSEANRNSVLRQVQTFQNVKRFDIVQEKEVMEVGFQFLPVGDKYDLNP